MKVGTILVAALAAATPALALPSTRTLRGVSPYKALHGKPSSLEEARQLADAQMLKPHGNGGISEATERHMLQYRDAYWNPYTEKQRPEWGDRLVERFNAVAERLDQFVIGAGLDLSALKAFAHWISTPREQPRYKPANNEHFDLTGVFDHSEYNVTRQDLDSFEDFAPGKRLPYASGFRYGDDNHPVRGVNLGNWLLFELWMDPGLNSWLNDHARNAPYYGAIVDEWTAGLYSDKNFLRQTMNDHFNSWIKEEDFRNIAAAGLNHIRVPVPYFMWDDLLGSSPFVSANRFEKVKYSARMAKKYGLKVWIDLHGVPGSQNGYDNSGKSGPIRWPYNQDYIRRTEIALKRLISEFAKPEYKGTVTGIQAVNEPAANRNNDVKNLLNSYYNFAHNAVAHPNDNYNINSNLTLIIHDGFLGLRYWQDFWQGNMRHRVLLDKHPYFVYSPEEKRMKDTQRLRKVCDLSDELWTSEQYYPGIMGEWAPNGPSGDRDQDRDFPVNRSPVKFPPGPNYPYSQKYMVFMSRNWATQVQTYEYNAAGWLMWSWKNAGSLDWSYSTGLRYGWIPKNAGAQPWGSDICRNL